ncbi:PAS domain S-box protein [Schlegelella sp. S2-27]|uniref:PAS domain S-box protein n=1 Tax=Caldimonas mangrovi TaxID=2944811 RepID=A0ABT0YME9_9BURK|nr:PAS domain S-box protein [Caldimonas mangrovi]MCM5679427.1 PAS domain S-box protein [Caldimonas mangrovi]
MSAQHESHSPADRDEAFERAAVPMLALTPSGAVVRANASLRALLNIPANTSVSSLVAPLGLTAVQWVLSHLRLAAREPGFALAAVTGPRVMLPSGVPVRLCLAGEPPGQWTLRFERAGGTPAPAPRRADHAEAEPPERADDIALRELRRMFWYSPFPVVLQDAQYRVVDVNQAFLDYSGYARSDLIGLDPMVLFHPDDREQHESVRRQLELDLERAESSPMTERRFLDAGGQTRWYRAAHRRVYGSDGQAMSLTVLHDCTAEHQARERADRSVHELDQWFDLTPVGMMLFDEDGLVVRSNPALQQLIGRVPFSLAKAHVSLQELLGWYAGGPLAALHPDSEPLHRHGWVDHEDEDRALHAVVRCLEERHGHRRYMVVIEDRTAEDRLDMAQSQLGALAETAQAGLATFNEHTGRFQFDRRTARGAGDGLVSSELKAISRDLVRSDTLPDFDRVQQAVRQGERVDARYAIQHPELGTRWLQTRVEPRMLNSGKRSTSVVTLDVTEQHLMQQRSERLLRELTTILESTTTGIAYLRGETLLRYNRQFERMLGLEPDAALDRRFGDLLPASVDAQRLVDEAMQVLAGTTLYETEIEISLPGQPLRWCALSMRRMEAGGSEIESIVVLADVTRLKMQQAELEALARDRELMFSLSDVGIAFLRDGRVQRASEGFCLLSGYGAGELETLEERALFTDDNDYQRLRAEHTEALLETGRWTGERLLRRKDGTQCWVQVHKRLVHEGDPEGGVIASYVNVDARRLAEQALATQAERTRAILDSVLVGIVTVGAHGIEWMNRSARRMFGGDLADFAGRPINVVASSDPSHPFQRLAVEHLEHGQTQTFECQVMARDGRNFWVVGNAVVTGVGPRGREITYALLDIDSRRQAEQRIADAQASLRRLIDLAPLAIALRDARTLRILQINPIAAALSGREAGELVGCAPEDMYPAQEAEMYRGDMEAALAVEGVTQREYRVTIDGQPTVWDARYLPLSRSGQPPDQLLLVAANVTEQRAAQEARLEAAISQRELLVKEVHHRIKNNLQGVAGLLQQIAGRKPEMAGPISEVAGQVQAIAHVYGLQVGAVGPLRLKRVVEAITGSVQKTFDRSIALTIEGEHVQEWALPEAESIPIALTLNELLTNAIKHSASGDVGCRLQCEDDAVEIEVSNPGQLPPGFTLAQFPGGVSGLGLIRALLPRRSARLTLDNDADRVRAVVRLTPPGVTRLTAL